VSIFHQFSSVCAEETQCIKSAQNVYILCMPCHVVSQGSMTCTECKKICTSLHATRPELVSILPWCVRGGGGGVSVPLYVELTIYCHPWFCWHYCLRRFPPVAGIIALAGVPAIVDFRAVLASLLLMTSQLFLASCLLLMFLLSLLAVSYFLALL
jgi:hypothetical protein